MDEFIKRLCVRLASQPFGRPGVAGDGPAARADDHPSRRGFLRTVGKVTLGAAAIATGEALFTRPAEAATALHCCEGIACGFHGCLHGMAIGYTWSCGGYFCHDCFTDDGNGDYYCTYTVARGTSRHHTTRRTTRRAATTTYYTPPEDYYYGPPPGFWGD